MTYAEALAYIHSFSQHTGTPHLSRTAELLSMLDSPQNKLSYIHIAGTNGKGSTCAMLASVLCEAGYKTGLFTSPYIRDFCERIQISGMPIDRDSLVRLTERTKKCVERLGEPVSEFELITVIGFAYFAEQEVDVVVLEVGLGGRFDPTNVIQKPLLSIITGIDFDHTAYLGNTIQEIAAEKAGIIKEGCPCLYGGAKNAAGRTIRAFADQKHAPYVVVDRTTLALRHADLEGSTFDFGGRTNLHISLLGAYQLQNASTVIAAIDLLKQYHGLTVPEDALCRGLARTRWQARFELLSVDPVILYDGGHNPQGITACVQSIKTYFPDQPVNILSGVMSDKDYDEMVELIKPVAQKAFTVPVQNPRTLSSEDYAACFARHKIPVQAYTSVKEAVREAIDDSRKTQAPLLCLGSLYLYSEVADAIRDLL